MTSSARGTANQERGRVYRARLRRQAQRPVQISDLDTRSLAFAAEAHRQPAAIAASPHEAEDQAFTEAISKAVV